MRVCFICPQVLPLFAISPDRPFGGAEVQVHTLANYLARRGFGVDIIVGSSPGFEEQVAGDIRLIPGIDETSGAGIARKVGSKLKLVRALRKSAADVYVATCAGPEVAFVALCARAWRRKLIYRTAHEIDCDGTYERTHGLRGRMFGLGLRSADLVVAQHDEQRRELAAQGLPVQVVHSAFKIDAAHPASERHIDALWVGRCEAWKRPELFLELAKSFPSRKFVMICHLKQGHEAYFEKVRGLAAECANLSFIERVPFSEVHTYFESARLLVGTSEHEGFPNTYIQACIAGTPIAALKVDPDKFIETERAGVSANGDFERLKSGIELLLSDADEWRKCSENARAYARRSHDVEVQGAKWADLLVAVRGRSRSENRVGHRAEKARRN
jgi:glycosyltransferase involved in cell wall biosynthesis